MGKERKCILCEMICISKQEMDEHMRSMLHHRELENLKGRDCGHECKVCRVTVVSLTDYASHISSTSHKQNVEAAECKKAGIDQDEDYFDRALVDLIEKRKESIRKEEEAAAAKRAKEEERRKQQEFEQRLKDAKERFRQDCAWRQRPRGPGGANWQEAWNWKSFSGGGQWDAQDDSKHWPHSRQGKSATWHAQEPPNFQNWESGAQWAGGSLRSQQVGGDNRSDQGASGNHRSRLPWLSNGGSSNGVYGRNNIPQCPPVNRPMSLFGPIPGLPLPPPPPTLFAPSIGQVQNQGNGQEGRQGDGHQNKEGPNAEHDWNNGTGPKTFGSNPKLDKTCRWSPYPPTKLFDSASQKDTHPSPSEKYSKTPTSQKRETAPDTNPSNNRQSQSEQKPKQSSSPGDIVEGKRKRNRGKKNQDRSSSSSRSSSAQRDGQKSSLPGPSKQRADKPSEPKDKRLSVTSTSKGQLSRASSQESEQSKSSSKHSGHGCKSSHSAVLQSVQDQRFAGILKKVKETILDKGVSVDISTDSRMETVLHIVEEQQKERSESQVGANKENNGRQDRSKAPMPELIRPSLCGEEKSKSGMSPSDGSQSLQSVQVSTSTVESSGPVASTREDEEEEDGRKTEEEGRGPVATDEAMQAVESGQGSESDLSLRGSEAQTTSGSTASGLKKPGLPSVLKRDLTKHMSTKSKTVSHEPNLNSARRVRNVSGSRRVEAEKESGLKPTVRQLISSSGARRSVNWEQVYQEVCRKKQEQGKGMPRFGIEMVSHDPEELSQDDDDIPVLEGFQWESLLDTPTPRKRCLSESSIAPDCSSSGRSLFPSQTPGERPTREGLCRPGRRSSEQQGSSSSNLVSLCGNGDHQQQQEEDRRLGQCEPRAQKQPDGTEKTLRRYDSVPGDSSSGTELYDATGTGKRRRAAGDIPNPELPNLERKNKRRKIKSKKERSQVDQLLAVSLREEELSSSLQTVDNSLLQARAALQAAYMEVQRLMVVKQQMSDEMSTLRNRRIDLLKGMQGDLEGAAQIRVKEEPMDSITAEPDVASLMHSITADPDVAALSPPADDPAVPSPPPQPYQGPQCASPPSSTLPFTPVVVKQEPLSPVRIHTEPEPDPEEEMVHCAHSTTPEMPVPPVSPSHTDCQLSPERTPELHKANGEPAQKSFGAPGECKRGSLDAGQSVERPLQVECRLTQTDSKPFATLSPASRRSSEAGSLADPSTSPAYDPSSVPLVFSVPLSPIELRSGKRVRKLKKRRVLKKAQGAEPAENSDTELEGEAARPVRPLRPRRRSSAGSHVSTSTPPAAVEDEEGDKAKERDREEVEEEEEEEEGASSPLSPATKSEQVDSDSSLEMVELPQAAPAAAAVRIDSSDQEDSSMEVTCQDAQMDSQTSATAPAPAPAPAPDTSTTEPQNLACNEVTSTSEMDVTPAAKPYESDVHMAPASPKMSKTSTVDVLDLSSDPGEYDMPTEGAFEGHQEMVNAMQIHSGLLYTCSGDRTVKAFNLVTHRCVAMFDGHSSKVNCLWVSATPGLQHRLYSGSSDQTVRCYSLKTGECVEQFSLSDRVLCLHSRWHVLYAGLANGTVVTFNLKTNKLLDVFDCHGPRAVSCLASAQEGARRLLLVGSYDNTISVRDAKNGLLLRTLEGHTKTVLCLKVVNDLVFSGSSDQSVHAHNIHTGELVRIYKGHNHAVTVVAILGKVMVTACLDKLVRVYELQSHDRLQVYGGHNDMVMCMAVHKSMIYTGCYDGSVKAVKLNLMQNHRCLWHGCSMIFGVMEHLQQHLINDHASPNFQTLKCRWKNCDEFFSARNGSKQGMPNHMQKHTEEEAKLEP